MPGPGGDPAACPDRGHGEPVGLRPPEDIAADLLDAAPVADIQALRLARWAVRRLEGQGATGDLRGFWGLHRGTAVVHRRYARPQAEDLDHLARSFLDHIDCSGLHPLARGPHARVLWRLAGLSPDGEDGEAAIWVARDSASACAALPFAPLGRAHLRPLVDNGTRGRQPDHRRTPAGATLGADRNPRPAAPAMAPRSRRGRARALDPGDTQVTQGLYRQGGRGAGLLDVFSF